MFLIHIKCYWNTLFPHIFFQCRTLNPKDAFLKKKKEEEEEKKSNQLLTV
jgi:hypothetical protein